ncbi:MAG TPA: TetR/AcrR family transcriptional regulator [Burkholderiales bacterium]|nr:TetR/AcrR family transcriptional regulator [Burkholderiales bacterium]
MRKGARTRALILNEAVLMAGRLGLEGLSIGSLAARLDLSKSGLFAHFGSKEDLQLLTLKRAQAIFQEQVFSPASEQARGLPRLRTLLSRWLAWIGRNDAAGGHLLLSAFMEYDERPGAVRDLLVATQRELRGAVVKAIRLAIDQGDLAPGTDPWQLGFELYGIVLAAYNDRRLLADSRSTARAEHAVERLIQAHRPAATG